MDSGRNPGKRPAAPPILERFRARLKEREQTGGPITTSEMVRLYEEALNVLTSNSKLVITELSMIAGVQQEHAKGIAKAICDRILEVPMEKKLPCLYLLDCIVKNVGREYLKYFEARLPEVVLETYRKLNPRLRPAMLRLLKTWPPYFHERVLNEIAISLQANQKPACSGDLGNSGSHSSRLLHGVNVISPKHMEACRQSEYSALDARYTRPPLTLQSCRQKSSSRYGEMDLDHHDLLRPRPGFERIGTSAISGVENMPPHPSPSSPSRSGPKINTFPERVVDRSSLSEVGSGSTSGWNGGLARNLLSGDGAQKPEASVGYNHNNGCDKLHARLMIDSYGIKGSSHEKLPKFQQLDFYDISSDKSMKDSKSSEEEHVWGSMSPTPGCETEQYVPPLFGHNPRLTRSNAAFLGKHFGSDWDNQAFLPQSDDPSNPGHRTFSDKFQYDVASHKEKMLQYQGSYHVQGPLKFSNVSQQASQPISAPRSQGKLLQIPYSASGMSLTIAQKNSLSFGDGCQAEVPIGSLSSTFSDSLKSEASIVERRLTEKPYYPNSVSWPLVHNSQPLPLSANPSHELLRSPFDSESSKPIANSRANQRLFLHRQQFDTDHITKLNSISSQHLSLQQTTTVSLESHKVQERTASLASAPVSLHLTPHTHCHSQEQGAVISSSMPNLLSGITPPNPSLPQSSLYSSRRVHLPLCPASPHHPAAAPHHHPAAPLPATVSSSSSSSAAAAVVSPAPAAAPLPPPLPCHSAYPRLYPALPPLPSAHHPTPPRLFSPIPPPHPITASSHPLPILSPPMVTQSNSFTFLGPPSGPLPLPPAPLHASSQRRHASQSTEWPSSAFSGLISSLMAQGLISLISPNPSQDAVGIDFNADFLKVRHESSINALYGDLARQCTTCGMRFRSEEVHSSHMDWHLSISHIVKNHKQKPSRNWYVSSAEWLSLPGFFLTESVGEKKDGEVAVPADEDQCTCVLCGEPFEDFYSDEMEEWLYKGAVYLNAPNGSLECIDRSKLGPIVHARCRPEPADGFGKI